MTPSDLSTDRQTVGDILLAQGYVTQDQLDHAHAAQQATGKPLGQILVEAGAITRLELASALAEQWSDTSSWLGPPTEREPRQQRKRQPTPPLPDNPLAVDAVEIGVAQQLQEAVMELGRRVAAIEPTLIELRRRTEESADPAEAQAVAGRVGEVEVALDALTSRFDEMTEALDRTLTSFEEGSAAMATDIETIEERLGTAADVDAIAMLRAELDQVAALAGDDGGVGQRIDALLDRLEALESADGPAAGIAELGARLDTLAETDVHSLAARVDELAARLDRAAAADDLSSLRAALDELAARPAADPELAVRLQALAERLDSVATADDLSSLRAALDELAARPAADPELAVRLQALAERLDGFAAETAAVGTQLGPLAARVDELAAAVASRDEADELGALRARLEEVAAGLAAAGDALVATDELRARVDELAGAEPDTSVTDALRAAVDELRDRPVFDPQLADAVAALAARLDGLGELIAAARDDGPADRFDIALAELRQRVEELGAARAELAQKGDTAELATRLGDLAARVEALAAAEPTAIEFDASPLQASVAELGERLDAAIATHAAATAVAELAARVDDLGGRVDALASSEPQAVVPDTGALESGLAELREQVDRLGSAPDETGGAADLIARLEELATRMDALASAESAAPDTSALETSLAELAMRIEEISAAPVEASTDGLREELEARIAEVADGAHRAATDAVASLSELEARLSALETRPLPSPVEAAVPVAKPRAKGAGTSPDDADVPELERLRMTVERINLHLSERERAISELMKTRVKPARVEELESRLAALEEAGGVAPAPAAAKGAAGRGDAGKGDAVAGGDLGQLLRRIEELEAVAAKDREKIFTQLERMASSIDWRIRRLETGETAAA